MHANWEFINKMHEDVRTMNTALMDWFIALITEPYKAEFNLARYSDPDTQFKDVFQYFLDDYGATTDHMF